MKKNIYHDSLILVLTVKDSNNIIAKDTVVIYKIQFKTYDQIGYKYPKDTVERCNSTGGTPSTPYSYEWRPNLFISDTSIKCPKFWPPYDLTYYCQVTDRFGCKSDFFQSIILKILDSSNVNIRYIEPARLIKNFHNPITSNSIFEFSKSNDFEKIEIYSNNGIKLYSDKTIEKFEIGRQIREKGIYFIVLYYHNNGVRTIKVERE